MEGFYLQTTLSLYKSDKPTVMLILRIQRRYFDAIASGEKTIEGRLDGPRVAGLTPGDALVLVCGDDRLERTVRSVTRYADFAMMLQAVGLAAALPGVESLAEGVAIYRAFDGYDRDVEVGVVAIGV